MRNRVVAVIAAIVVAIPIFFWPSVEDGILGKEKLAEEQREKDAEPIIKAETERLASDGVLTYQGGEKVSLRDRYNEKPVYMLFWMPWSDESLKALDVAHEAYKTYGREVYFIVVSMEYGRGEKDIQAVEAQYDLPFYHGSHEFAREFNAYSVPHAVFIKKNGTIQRHEDAIMTERQLAYALEQLKK